MPQQQITVTFSEEEVKSLLNILVAVGRLPASGEIWRKLQQSLINNNPLERASS